MRVVIAGGGTGGHLFPGIALADAFRQIAADVSILFVGTSKGLGDAPLLGRHHRFETVSAAGFIGKGFIGRMKSLLSIPIALYQSIRILRRFSPQLVIGMGGYAAGPVLLASVLLRLKRVILEPNVVPGLSNRLIAPFCHIVFTAFEETRHRLRAHTIQRLGMPVRPEIVDAKPAQNRQAGHTLLVLGGSQGAHSINGAMMTALPSLEALNESLFIIHQTGEKDQAAVRSAYQAAGFAAEVTAFIDDMAAAYMASDLVVSRAGAGTLSELAVLGKASLLIPFPYAAGHQEENAAAFVAAGAAVMLYDRALSGSRTALEIRNLLSDAKRRREMETAAKQQGNVNAAEAIVNACLGLLQE
ncbi:MAG: undecaprenyldiphospho-muramoylpentapeptide beta-N-acetylglucosaminyltransferase [Nitrospiria bacterium]